jgi:hypothetical protein
LTPLPPALFLWAVRLVPSWTCVSRTQWLTVLGRAFYTRALLQAVEVERFSGLVSLPFAPLGLGASALLMNPGIQRLRKGSKVTGSKPEPEPKVENTHGSMMYTRQLGRWSGAIYSIQVILEVRSPDQSAWAGCVCLRLGWGGADRSQVESLYS